MQGPDATSKPVGTGPFKFVEWVQGDHITLAKNSNYWVTGRPYLDGINTPIIRDAAAMMVQFESGALDVADNPPLPDYNRLKSDPSYRALNNLHDGQYFALGTNTTIAPFDNKLVRQALRFAIDRERMNDVALGGLGQPKVLPWLPNSAAYDETKTGANGFDLDKAASLLKDVGASSFSMDLLPLETWPQLDTVCQIYQADLAKIGITANILKLDFAQWLDQVSKQKYNGMYATSDSRAQLSPLTWLSAAGANPFKNNEGFQSETLLKLIDQLGPEVDPTKQKALLAQVNDLLLDESYYDIIASYGAKALVKDRVRDIEIPLFAGYSVTNAWLES
jgi:peptide/nickel transport system substrate-binding protein